MSGQTAIEIAIRALTDISDGLQCGCMPCRGDCWSKDALRDEVHDRADVARDALKAIAALPSRQIQCDEPADIFSRITRDMARSA